MTEASVPPLGDTRTFSDVIASLREEAYVLREWNGANRGFPTYLADAFLAKDRLLDLSPNIAILARERDYLSLAGALFLERPSAVGFR